MPVKGSSIEPIRCFAMLELHDWQEEMPRMDIVAISHIPSTPSDENTNLCSLAGILALLNSLNDRSPSRHGSAMSLATNFASLLYALNKPSPFLNRTLLSTITSAGRLRVSLPSLLVIPLLAFNTWANADMATLGR